jgi:uncharacterized YkwD family protein
MFLKRKFILIFFTVFSIFILYSNVFGANITNYKPKYGITNEIVNFRSSTSVVPGSVISTLSKNTKLKIVGTIDNFYIVQLESNKVGCIDKRYITINNVKPSTIDYTSVLKYTATVVNDSTNVRRGPSTNFTRVTRLNKGTKVTVIGKVNSFSLIIYGTNKIGMVESSLISKTIISNNTQNNSNTSTNLSNEDLLLKYINDERIKNKLPVLKTDNRLQEIAELKSKDMVSNDYFSHTSPSYGSPFNMMKNFGITYITAGENIAGNSTMKKIFDSWMESENHRKNILSNAYNYIGLGVVNSERYGYIATSMLIGK